MNIHTSLAILEDMLGLSLRLLLPPEFTEHLQITGRLFIYLYTSYISHQIKLALDFRPFSASRGCNVHRRSWNFLGEEIPRGKTIPNQVDDFSWNWSPNPGITENHKIYQSQLGFVFLIFLVQTVLETVRTSSSWLYEWRPFSCTLVILTWETLRWDQLIFHPLRCQPRDVGASCWQTPSFLNVASLRNITKMPTSRNLSYLSSRIWSHPILSCIPSEACARLGLEAFAC